MEVVNNVMNWASVLDDATLEQAERTARSAGIWGHLALMPDAHLGSGATIGSVIASRDCLIPAAVGVDIGCGIIAVKTSLKFPDLVLGVSMADLHKIIGEYIPAGTGRDHGTVQPRAIDWMSDKPIPHVATMSNSEGKALNDLAGRQLGTLGSGNHFVELSIDPQDSVWAVIHSGSRGIGHKLATFHIKVAQAQAKSLNLRLEDKNLAYLVEDSDSFNSYIADLGWAQSYAFTNRQFMMDSLLSALEEFAGAFETLTTINCHHNYVAIESHFGKRLWITRKGAIDAHEGVFGIVPGSMATATYIVEGKGEEMSYCSSAHGAGRNFSRRKARESFTEESLEKYMEGKTWNKAQVKALIDEHPEAYKDIETVMNDMVDLVKPVNVLHQFLNYKGA